MRTVRLVACTLVGISSVACAHGPGATPPEHLLREGRAMAALERDDFPAAREDLTWLVARCESREQRLRALLLLAAAELDPVNMNASPPLAAHAAAAYLVAPDATPAGLSVARALYRLAADLGGMTEVAADEGAAASWFGPPCEGESSSGLRALPSTSGAQRLSGPDGRFTSRADSLGTLTTRVRELEAELQRIRSVLRDDALTGPGGGAR